MDRLREHLHTAHERVAEAVAACDEQTRRSTPSHPCTHAIAEEQSYADESKNVSRSRTMDHVPAFAVENFVLCPYASPIAV